MSILLIKPWQKFQLNKALNKGENEEEKKRTQVQAKKKVKLKVGHKGGGKGTNYVLKLSLIARNNFFFLKKTLKTQ